MRNNCSTIDLNDLLQELRGETDDVRKLLPYENVRKTLNRSRLSNMPPSPDTLAEFIDKMEANEYPPAFQAMYKGHVSWVYHGEQLK